MHVGIPVGLTGGRMGEVAGRMVCPDCGTELTADLPLGLCPKCLLSSKGTLSESVTGEPEAAKASDVSSALGAAWRALSGGAAAEANNDPLEEDLRPPEIERYRIVRLLGAGGMVWAGRVGVWVRWLGGWCVRTVGRS